MEKGPNETEKPKDSVRNGQYSQKIWRILLTESQKRLELRMNISLTVNGRLNANCSEMNTNKSENSEKPNEKTAKRKIEYARYGNYHYPK